MDPSSKFSTNDGDLLENLEQYMRLMSNLTYLTLTCPNISFAPNVVSQYMQSPRKPHLHIVLRILRCLKRAQGQGCLFKCSGHLDMEDFSDADFAGCIDDRRPTTGYSTFVGRN